MFSVNELEYPSNRINIVQLILSKKFELVDFVCSRKRCIRGGGATGNHPLWISEIYVFQGII